MVNKISRQSYIPCAWSGGQPVKHHHFERCQWQKSAKPNFAYLIYHWCTALYFLITLIYSIIYPISGAPSWVWLAYLTHWAYSTCLLQAVLALYIIQRVHRSEDAFKPRGDTENLPLVHRIYWIVQTTAVVLAFTITLLYWVMEYDPATSELTAINILKHGGNSVVMVLDHFLVSHPTRLVHGVYPVTIGFLYGVFTYIYYQCNGTDVNGKPYIYEVLNWTSPGRSIKYIAIAMLVTAFMHFFAWLLFRMRCLLVRVCSRPKPPPQSYLAHQEKPILIEIPKL